MKRTGLRRRVSAWLLLAVFVPMLVLSALHTHAVGDGWWVLGVVGTAASDECVECVNHQPHAGHLTASAQTLTDCVLCQFFSLQYLEAAAVTLIITAVLAVSSLTAIAPTCLLRPLTLHSSRAPPVFYF